MFYLKGLQSYRSSKFEFNKSYLFGQETKSFELAALSDATIYSTSFQSPNTSSIGQWRGGIKWDFRG